MAQLFKQVVTDDDVIDVIDHLRRKATTSDDIAWTALFLAYAIGKPPSGEESRQASGIQIDGDVTLNLNQLPPDQLRAAKAALQTIDARFSSVSRLPESLPAATPLAH